MAKETKVEEVKKENKGIELVQVPTQHSLAYQLEDGSVLSTEEMLAVIANDIKAIKKAVC